MSEIEATARRLARTTGFAYDNLLQAGLLLVEHGMSDEAAARQVESLAGTGSLHGAAWIADYLDKTRDWGGAR